MRGMCKPLVLTVGLCYLLFVCLGLSRPFSHPLPSTLYVYIHTYRVCVCVCVCVYFVGNDSAFEQQSPSRSDSSSGGSSPSTPTPSKFQEDSDSFNSSDDHDGVTLQSPRDLKRACICAVRITDHCVLCASTLSCTISCVKSVSLIVGRRLSPCAVRALVLNFNLYHDEPPLLMLLLYSDVYSCYY